MPSDNAVVLPADTSNALEDMRRQRDEMTAQAAESRRQRDELLQQQADQQAADEARQVTLQQALAQIDERRRADFGVRVVAEFAGMLQVVRPNAKGNQALADGLHKYITDAFDGTLT